MVCTTSDEPPPVTSFHCVPRKWCKTISLKPELVWADAGTGGQSGALWRVGSFGLLQVTRGHQVPAEEKMYELVSSRFMLDGDSSGIWLPPTLSQELARKCDNAVLETDDADR